MDENEQFQRIVTQAKDDPHVIGLVLGGGRGKGVSASNSDYDFFLIVPHEAKGTATAEYGKFNVTEVIDGHVLTLDDLRNFGRWGSETAWAAYGFAHLTAMIDKTGEVQRVLEDKGTIPADRVHAFVEASLDAFINQYYRALKNDRDGNRRAADLDAAECIPFVLTVLFGREGRVRPYNKFLEWELARYPLSHLPWRVEEFLALLQSVLHTGDLATLKELYRRTRDTSLELGFTESIKGWDGYVLE